VVATTTANPTDWPAPLPAGSVSVSWRFGDYGERTLTIRSDGELSRRRENLGLYPIADCPAATLGRSNDYRRFAAFIQRDGSDDSFAHEYDVSSDVIAQFPGSIDLTYQPESGSPFYYHADGVDGAAPRELRDMLSLLVKTFQNCPAMRGTATEGQTALTAWSIRYSYYSLGSGSWLDLDSAGQGAFVEFRGNARRFKHFELTDDEYRQLSRLIGPLLDDAIVEGPERVFDCSFRLHVERYKDDPGSFIRDIRLPCKPESRSPNTRAATGVLEAIRARLFPEAK
jgi:hypothetical protein